MGEIVAEVEADPASIGLIPARAARPRARRPGVPEIERAQAWEPGSLRATLLEPPAAGDPSCQQRLGPGTRRCCARGAPSTPGATTSRL